MSYLNFVDRQAKAVTVFARITSKRRLTGSDFSLDSGEIYKFAWTDGNPISIEIARVRSLASYGTFTSVASYAAITNYFDYFYDSAAGFVYFRTSTDPTAAAPFESLASVEYYHYLSSSTIGWFETPDDDTSSMIEWAGTIVGVPEVRRSVADNSVGFTPTEISPLRVLWKESGLFEILRSDHFTGCLAKVWVCLGDVAPENFEVLFTGKIKGLSADDSEISFNLVDDLAAFDLSFSRTVLGELSDSVNPSEAGTILPIIYGQPRWLKGFNIDYIDDPLSTSDNRIWLFADSTQNEAVGMSLLTYNGGTLVGTFSPANEAKLHYRQYAIRSSDAKWCLIERNFTTGVITITGFSMTPAPGDFLNVCPFYEIYFSIPDEVSSVVSYTPNNMPSGWTFEVTPNIKLVLPSGFEAAATGLGITTIDPNNFDVYAKLVGPPLDQQTFGTNYFEGSIPTLVGCLYWYLTEVMGFATTSLDDQSFEDAWAAREPLFDAQDDAMFLSPCESNTAETHRDVVSRLLKEIGAVMFFDANGKISIKARDLISTADYTLTDSEIALNSISYEFSDLDRQYFQPSGVSPYVARLKTTIISKGPLVTTTRPVSIDGVASGVIASGSSISVGDAPVSLVYTYDFGRDLDDLRITFPNLFRLSKILGARKGLVSLTAYGSICQVNPGDVVQITREILPGNTFVDGTTNSELYFVLEVTRRGDAVDLILEDQYSIQEIGGL